MTDATPPAPASWPPTSPSSPVTAGRPAPVQWPTEPPLGPPPAVVPAPWSNRRPREPEPPPPPPRGPGRTVAVIAILTVIALAVASLVVVRIRDDDETSAPSDPSTTAAPPTTEDTGTTGSNFDAVIADISAFVERERGLTFKAPVNVELADDDEFTRRLFEDFDSQVDDLRNEDDVLTALGLLDPDVDLVSELRSLLGGGVVGFYDPEANELVVRGTSTSPYVRETIAHELTHALDDQYFELDRPDVRDADDESDFGFTALAEGDAVRIQNRYRDSMTAADQVAALTEEAAITAGIDIFAIPSIVVDSVVAPYQYGPDLIGAILDAGGQDALDTAFGGPPTTSEQVFDPEHYLNRDERKDVAVPAGDGEVFDEGAVGAFGLTEMLDGVNSNATDQAVDGWGGDWYVAWHDGDRTCVRAVFAGDTAGDTTEIYDALRDWADSQADASIELTADAVLLDSCG